MKDSNFLTENNARHMWHPMGAPAEAQERPPRIITSARDVRITDHEGHEVVDAVGGLWNVSLGYSCEPVKAAMAAQLDTLPYYSTFRGSSNDVVIELSYELARFFGPDGMSRAFFTSGGSDSVETALMLARQYHRIRGEAGRTKFISLRKGYHGTHFGAASVNGNTMFRQAYEPLLPGCFHVPAPYVYRNPWNETDPARLAQLCAAALEDEIAFQGPHTVAAFIMEPIMGAGGVIVPDVSFMGLIREVCDRHGVLLISDEVITGFGRTGAWSGARFSGVQPDMMTTAKAITNGYFPFGAVMIGGAMVAAFEEDTSGKALIGHGYTYSGHPVGAAAALACLAEMQRLDVVTNAAARGAQLFEGLCGLARKYDMIGDVRGGRGLMAGLELVRDRGAKTLVDPSVAARVHDVAYQHGAMVRQSGSNLLMSPPLILTAADVETIVAALDAGFAAV